MNESGSEQAKNIARIRKWGSTVIPILVMFLVAILIGTITKPNDVVADLESTPETQSTPTPTATPSPELVAVEFQLEVSDVYGVVPVQYWYTNDENGGTEIKSANLSVNNPQPESIEVKSGSHVEVSGVIDADRSAVLTCRIFVNDVLVEQSQGQGSGAGVYCGAMAISH